MTEDDPGAGRPTPPPPGGADLALVPRLAPHVRLQEDGRRDRWVLQAPERIFVLDEIALAVVRRFDGRPIAAVADELATIYDAPAAVIAADVLALVADLRQRGVVVVDAAAGGRD